MARVPSEIPRGIDVTRARLAYGVRQMPKLSEELIESDIVTLERALRSLADLASSVLRADEMMGESLVIVESLVRHLKHDDDAVRVLTAKIFEKLSVHQICREVFVRKNTVDVMASTFGDSSFEVRLSAFNTLYNIACTIPGSEQLVDHAMMPKLLTQLDKEEPEIKVVILDILYHLLTHSIQEGLGCQCMQAMKSHMQSDNGTIREKATRCVMQLCTPLEGKQLALDEGFVPELVRLLSDSSPAVRKVAAGAVMCITITTPGKYGVVKADGLEVLMRLADGKEENTTVSYALKALTCLAEEPQCKQTMLRDIARFKNLTKHPSQNVCNMARAAVKVITWLP